MGKTEQQLRDKAFRASMSFSSLTKELEKQLTETSETVTGEQMDELCKAWRKTFRKICQSLGIDDKKSIDSLFYGFGWKCHWDRLHKTCDEEQTPLSEWFHRASGEAFYGADRWTVERLLRAHWTVLRAIESYKTMASGKGGSFVLIKFER